MTCPGVNGSKAIVVIAIRPVCTVVHVEPPSVDLKREPCPFPARTAWLSEGSTASANTGDCPCFGSEGSEGSATHVESGSVAATAPAHTTRLPIIATRVAARRRLESDTSLPTITQGWPRIPSPTPREAGIDLRSLH